MTNNTTITIQKEPMTDGTFVYNVRVIQLGSADVVIGCEDEYQAEEVRELLNKVSFIEIGEG